jgi:hypothetical protein
MTGDDVRWRQCASNVRRALVLGSLVELVAAAPELIEPI